MIAYKLLGLFLAFWTLAFPGTFALNRIVGGIETTIERRPYQASLQYLRGLAYYHNCGASIISTRYLLSAAHCNPGNGLNILYARVGSTRYDSGGQVVKVTSFQPHQNYQSSILDYDFAIVTLASTIVLGPNVVIIPLTNGNNPSDGSLVTVSGWGVTSESSSLLSINLREVDLPVVSEATCKLVYSFITNRQMCLGGTPQGGLSACFGDSGGPVVQNGVQYALVSGGNSCEEPNVPGIYARISSVRSWITDITGV